MNRLAFATLIVLAVPAAGRAQPRPDYFSRTDDRRELRQDRRDLADDGRDLAWIERLIGDFDAARARRNRRALARVEGEVARTLAREVREGRLDLARSRGEIRRDAYDGRWERRDDRRDLRDDRRDLRRVALIEREFGSLRGRMDRRSLDRKRTLLAELHGLARAELREDGWELREDRRDAWDVSWR